VAPLDLDLPLMRVLEQAGLFRVWTATENGRLVGFILFHIQPHLFHHRTLFAIDAGHYLDPSYRVISWTGIKMWRSAIAALKELGVKVIVSHDSPSRPLSAFFRRLGFVPRSTLFWWVAG
jgi:Acetyltransferase (GNAT) family